MLLNNLENGNPCIYLLPIEQNKLINLAIGSEDILSNNKHAQLLFHDHCFHVNLIENSTKIIKNNFQQIF